MTCCYRMHTKSLNLLQAGTFRHVNTKLNTLNQTKHLYLTKTERPFFRRGDQIIDTEFSNERRTLDTCTFSTHFVRAVSTGKQLSSIDSQKDFDKSSFHISCGTPLLFKDATHSYSYSQSAGVKFSKKYSLIHNQSILDSSLSSTTAGMQTPCCMPYKFLSCRMLHHGRVQKYLLGSTVTPAYSLMWYSTDGSVSSAKQDIQLSGNKASQLKLIQTKERFTDLVQKIFTRHHDYRMLHTNIVLENNLFGKNKRRKGLLLYAVELLKIRLRVHVQYSSTYVEVKSFTVLKEDKIIRVHWILAAVPQAKLLKVLNPFQRGAAIVEEDFKFIEAYSDFYIDKDGLILKHRIDRVIPSMEKEADDLKPKGDERASKPHGG